MGAVLLVMLLLLFLGKEALVADAFWYQQPTTCVSSRHQVSSALSMSFQKQETSKSRKFQRKFGNVVQQMHSLRQKRTAENSISRDPLVPKIERLVQAALNRKAGAVTVMRVGEWSDVAEFMIIMEGYSRPQLQAITGAIEDEMLHSFQETPFATDGKATSGWMLLDYGDIIVHVMTPVMRGFYKLENRWKDAEILDIRHLQKDDKSLSLSEEMDPYSESEDFGGELKDETDPFWS
jgi:ribosome-associated protein